MKDPAQASNEPSETESPSEDTAPDDSTPKEEAGETQQGPNAESEERWGVEPEVDAHEDRGPGLLAKAGAWLRGIRPKRAEDGLTPLELRTRLLDNVEETLWEYRAHRPLPFVQLTVHILATDPRLYQRYDDALEQVEPPFPRAVLESLRAAGLEPLSDLAVDYALYDAAPDHLADAFDKYGSVYVAYARRQAKRSAVATLSVVTGKTEEASYHLTSDRRFNVGRLREVREGSYGHLVRQNDIAFLGEDSPDLDAESLAVNNTVSRKHARIEYDMRSGQFFLYKVEGDTVISRRGHDAPVQVLYQPIALEDGDLIYLGRACLRFETGDS